MSCPFTAALLVRLFWIQEVEARNGRARKLDPLCVGLSVRGRERERIVKAM